MLVLKYLGGSVFFTLKCIQKRWIEYFMPRNCTFTKCSGDKSYVYSTATFFKLKKNKITRIGF